MRKMRFLNLSSGARYEKLKWFFLKTPESPEGDFIACKHCWQSPLQGVGGYFANLFGVQRPAITKHLKNIFETGELKEEVVCSILEHTTQHGAMAGRTQETKVKYYNLDAIISIGYRGETKREQPQIDIDFHR